MRCWPRSRIRTPTFAAAAEQLAVAVRRLDARDLMGRPAPWIATCFAAAGQPAAGGVLRSVLDDPDARVCAAGAEIVTAFPDEADRSIPLLIDRLRDPAASVRSAAAEALAQFGEKSRPALRLLLAILADPEVRGEHDQRLEERGHGPDRHRARLESQDAARPSRAAQFARRKRPRTHGRSSPASAPASLMT